MKAELQVDTGILVVHPTEALSKEIFEGVSDIANPYIEEHGHLKGLLIEVKHFPHWENFAGLVSHIKFVKEHHKLIDKIAFVTDDKVLSYIPAISDHFVKAEVKHFAHDDKQKAIDWMAS